MSTDYAKKERAFLDALKADTGHTLEEWLVMIGAEMLEERNDIIDWLRQHGFTFSRASWIERIHHNGGQPIYADRVPGTHSLKHEPPASLAAPLEASKADRTKPGQTPTKTEVQAASTPKQDVDLRVVSSRPEPSGPKPKSSQDATEIEQTLARAKGLRPLAQHVLAEIKTVVPDVKISAFKSALVLASGDTRFGLLALSAKDLRLGLALTPSTPQTPFQTPQFTASYTRISENITHMLILDDVRQITPAVLSGVQNAATRA